MDVELTDFLEALDGALEAKGALTDEIECGWDVDSMRHAEINCTLTKANVIEVVFALINKAHSQGKVDAIREHIQALELRDFKFMNGEG